MSETFLKIRIQNLQGCMQSVYTCYEKDCTYWTLTSEEMKKHKIHENRLDRTVLQFGDYLLNKNCIEKKHEVLREEYINKIGKENINKIILLTFIHELVKKDIRDDMKHIGSLLYYFGCSSFQQYDLLNSVQLINEYAIKHSINENQAKEILRDIVSKCIKETTTKHIMIKEECLKLFNGFQCKDIKYCVL